MLYYGYHKCYCWSYVNNLTDNTDFKNTNKSSATDNSMSTHTAMTKLPETSISSLLGE